MIRTFYLIIPFLLIFSIPSKAQYYFRNEKALKNLEEIVLKSGSGVTSLFTDNDKSTELTKFIHSEYRKTFKRLFNKLNIEIIEYDFQSPKPPHLYLQVYTSETSPKVIEVKFQLYILEPVIISRSKERIDVGSWILEEEYDFKYSTFNNLKFEISELIREISKEFELDYYRSKQ